MPTVAEDLNHDSRALSTSASTGLMLTGYVLLGVVTVIGTNLEGLLAGAMFGGRSPQVSAAVPAAYLVTCTAVLAWTLVIVLTGAVSRTWWAISPLVIAVAAYALRVVIVGFHPGDVSDVLIIPAMIIIGCLIAYSCGRTRAKAPGHPAGRESAGR